MKTKIENLFNQFVQSDKIDVFRTLNYSEETTKTEENHSPLFVYAKRYKKIKEILKEFYGDPVAEDVNGRNFSAFQLSKHESIASLLTLYNYKDCRFGVFLYSEDECNAEICLSACRPGKLPVELSIDEELKLFIDKFSSSIQLEKSKQIKESGFFFDEDEEEFEGGEEGESLWEYTYKEFKAEYEKIKGILKENYGEPIAEDIIAYKFKDFPLAKCERKGGELTLFNYHECRFGVLIFQEDKELPLELYITACRPDRL